MSLRIGPMTAWCSCPYCCSCGPKIDSCGLSKEEVVDKMRLRMSGSVITVDVSKDDRVRRDLQIVSGRYAALKAGDLPYAERCVREAYRMFKFDSVKPKDLDFHAWIKEMAKSTARLDRALDYRERATKQFAEVKTKLRRLQRELKAEKEKKDERSDLHYS